MSGRTPLRADDLVALNDLWTASVDRFRDGENELLRQLEHVQHPSLPLVANHVLERTSRRRDLLTRRDALADHARSTEAPPDDAMPWLQRRLQVQHVELVLYEGYCAGESARSAATLRSLALYYDHDWRLPGIDLVTASSPDALSPIDRDLIEAYGASVGFHGQDPASPDRANALALLARELELFANVLRSAAVIRARVTGQTWAAVGAMLGTSAQAAQQRFGSKRP